MGRGDEQIVRSDAIFREANDGIRAARDALPLAGDPVPFICECADEECTEIIRVPLAEYVSVRSSAAQAVIAEGHRHDGEIVSRGTGFEVVRRQET